MSSVLVRSIHTLATMDAKRRELHDAAIYVRDNAIVAVGALAEMPDTTADLVIDARAHVVLPGLVNTHHHLFQTLTRALAQDADLFSWLPTLYPIWSRLSAEGAYVAAKLGMAELMLSGCTTTNDHLYLFPTTSGSTTRFVRGTRWACAFTQRAARASYSISNCRR
ncbi:MAG: amidohydrolase family protein [Casimicrobiaceae bacterium]